MLWSQRLKGDVYLAYRAVVAHPWRKFRELFEDRTGTERFLANYASEGNLPMTVDDRRVLEGAARCIHCGLCDAYDPALSQLPRVVYDGASLLPVAFSRAVPDLPGARDALSRMSESSLIRAEAVCPTRVPLREIFRYLQRKLVQLGDFQTAERPPQ